MNLIPSNSNIFVHGGAATPNTLLKHLTEVAQEKGSLNLIHLHTEGPALYKDPKLKPFIKVTNLFLGSNLRNSIDFNRIDYLPCFLSEIPDLFKSQTLKLDVALLHVSPPDAFGYCSLGVSVDVAQAAAASAKILIAQVNPNMPWVHGDGLIHKDRFQALIHTDESLYEPKPHEFTPAQREIGKHVSQLVEDRSTLQMGIGAIPDAVAKELIHHKDLGLHTEMWSDGALQLIEKGVITNAFKKVHSGKTVSSFMIGSRRLYDHVNDNPSILNLGADYVNNPINIARNPKVVAINSAVEVDLTGQVCADSIGHRIISGVGGQMDFIRGASLSEGGKPIIALTSTTSRGESKIVAELKPGAGVVTTRAHVHYVVTEYGSAQLHGKTLGKRAKALIEIAHPKHRESLEKDFWTVKNNT